MLKLKLCHLFSAVKLDLDQLSHNLLRDYFSP